MGLYLFLVASFSKPLSKASFKNIVAFLNTGGGVVLVGIKDNGDITGLNEELEKFYSHYDNSPVDKFNLHLNDLFKTQIGLEFTDLVEMQIVKVNNKFVLKIKCMPSDKPVFLNDEEFYIRSNASTELLKGRSMQDYINRRFKN